MFFKVIIHVLREFLSFIITFTETCFNSGLWNPGLDYLSFAAFDESPATHKVILKGRVSISFSIKSIKYLYIASVS